MSAVAVITLLDTILMLATEIPALFQKASALKAEIKAIVDAGRELTTAEWDNVNSETQEMLGFLNQRAKDAQAHLDKQLAQQG